MLALYNGTKRWRKADRGYRINTDAVPESFALAGKESNDMNKNCTRLIALVITLMLCVNWLGAAVSAVGESDPVTTTETTETTPAGKPSDYITINKTATALDPNEQTKVTLNVGGPKDDLGVDIIYILGGYLGSEEAVGTNLMISCLKDTVGQIVAEGTTVNFGIVPFSSTANPVMILTPFETEEDMEHFGELVFEAIRTAGDIYDGINMENALTTAKQMFAGSDLADHPERQHLVMISSGSTYYFNSGDNNEHISTVPVRYIDATGVDSKALFGFPQMVWQRSRLNETNSYPIPYYFVQEYNNNPGKYSSLWDCYWYYIDLWARADIAAGDTVVYEAASRAAGDFIDRYINGDGFAYHSDQSRFKYGACGAIFAGVGEDELEGYVTIDLSDPTAEHGLCGPNPLTVESAAHAISYERAMWEAYTYMKENIKDAGIHFYPIYNKLRADGSTTNGYFYRYTDQFIGHSFMNMMAGGTAVTYSPEKTFFDPIKQQIMGSVDAGSYVEDYIGYDAEKGNFELVDEASAIELSRGGVIYTTSKLETPMEGATSTYVFTAPGAAEPTFWMHYYRGNGETTERFVWRFGESVSTVSPAQLTYRLQLINRSEEEGTCTVNTNIIATLHPKDGEPRGFPIPKVTYTVEHTLGSIVVTKKATGATTPAGTTFQLQKLDGNDWVNVGEAVAFSSFVDNVYTFTELEEGTYKVVERGAEVDGYALETVYSGNVVLTKTTAQNGNTAVGNGAIEVTNTYTEIHIPVHTLGSVVVTKKATGATTPAGTTFQLQKLDGNDWVNVGEAVAFSSFVDNVYTFTELEEGTYKVVERGAEVDGYTLETVYSEQVVLIKTTAQNGDTAVGNGAIEVTNKYKVIQQEEPPVTPETGDFFRLDLWVSAMAVSAAMLALLLLAQKKRETN